LNYGVYPQAELMILSTRVKKIEDKIADIKNVEQEKNYKYIFLTRVDFEDGKWRGLVNNHGKIPIIILDE
jgi:hypothetical protein